MGKRGPKKTPATIKKARGTFRKDRDDTVLIPNPVKVPSAPFFLADDAKELWAELGALLVPVNLLTEIDVPAFALLCQAWADWKKAVEEVEHWGTIACSDSGNQYQHPAVGIRNRCFLNLLRAIQEFGLSPASRTKPVDGAHFDGDNDPAVDAILGIGK